MYPLTMDIEMSSDGLIKTLFAMTSSSLNTGFCRIEGKVAPQRDAESTKVTRKARYLKDEGH